MGCGGRRDRDVPGKEKKKQLPFSMSSLSLGHAQRHVVCVCVFEMRDTSPLLLFPHLVSGCPPFFLQFSRRRIPPSASTLHFSHFYFLFGRLFPREFSFPLPSFFPVPSSAFFRFNPDPFSTLHSRSLPPCSPERPADLCARPCGRREGEGLHFNTRVFHNTHTQGAKICTHKKRPCRKRGECLFWRVSHGHCVNRKYQNVRPPAHKHSGKNTGQHAASMLSIFDTCVFRAIFFCQRTFEGSLFEKIFL